MKASVLALIFCLGAAGVSAEPMTLDAVLAPKDDISLAFKDDKNHFVTLVERQGTAAGSGVFEGATVTEYGLHDVTLGDSARASGYIEATTTGGDTAYFRWRLRAFFVAGSDGEDRIVNSGHWELAGGTGQFASLKGVGSLRLEFVSKTERRYILEGDLSPVP